VRVPTDWASFSHSTPAIVSAPSRPGNASCHVPLATGRVDYVYSALTCRDVKEFYIYQAVLPPAGNLPSTFVSVITLFCIGSYIA
jgi:hypothetical protein